MVKPPSILKSFPKLAVTVATNIVNAIKEAEIRVKDPSVKKYLR
jgi:hypothetical protein